MYYEINGNILPQVRLVSKAVLEPPYVHKKRQLDEFVLYVVTKGTLFLKENGREYTLTEGSVILLDPDFVHEGIKASSCEYYYVHFRHPQIKRRRKDEGLIERCIKKRNDSLLEDRHSYQQYRDVRYPFPKVAHLQTKDGLLNVNRLLSEAIEQNRNQLEYYKIPCECKIMEAMILVSREAVTVELNRRYQSSSAEKSLPKSYHKVQDLLVYLNGNYHKDITSEWIEEQFDTNFDYLNRVFKQSTGKPIFTYLNEIRIRRACEMIATTSMKITVIAFRCGFQDESYFSKVFKKHVGISPKLYEQRITDKDRLQKKPL